jgi:5-methylcytosine-specific restriction endonuclease McrBC GTP-binding regulatory subunit McrB
MIQFHQSYAYEDFIQGFRPTESGGFRRKNGVFYLFCKMAQQHPELDFVFVIDEINRGNLSKIFGELFQLIERDKRGEEHAIPLTYAPEERFYLPENLYVIGMMNTADRSLAMVDHALRRRFSFVTLKPKFDDTFAQHLRQKGVTASLTEKIISGMNALNDQIAEDKSSLGPGFCIGHSYFCPINGEQPNEDWHRSIVQNEIKLLLEEYWFDNPAKADELIETLLS